MLTLTNVEVKFFDIILVLKGISLEVEEGKIAALLGANGAGKTTTLKAISGLLTIEDGRVTDGSITYLGRRIERKTPQEIVRMGIMQIPEGRRVLEHLTVEENLKVGGISQPASTIKPGLDKVYASFPRLLERRTGQAGYLSGGEQQMLVVGRAMMSRPKIILVDEASLGLSPLLVKEIFSILKRFNQEEKTALLLVEQNVRAALEIADFGYIIENGKIVLDGTADKLKSNEDIREFYMGIGKEGQRKHFSDVKHYKRRKRWIG